MVRGMRLAASVVQAALYGLQFDVPLTAISGAWLDGCALTPLGGVALAPPLAESHALGVRTAEGRSWRGDAILWPAGAHASPNSFTTAFSKTVSCSR